MEGREIISKELGKDGGGNLGEGKLENSVKTKNQRKNNKRRKVA